MKEAKAQLQAEKDLSNTALNQLTSEHSDITESYNAKVREQEAELKKRKNQLEIALDELKGRDELLSSISADADERVLALEAAKTLASAERDRALAHHRTRSARRIAR